MSYSVHEIFFTLQGEGARTGRPAVFLRFAGCNLWSGHEKDRASAVCKFCDTWFVGTGGVGGGKFRSAEALASAVANHWPARESGSPYVVCTGGEPLLQLDVAAVDALKSLGFEVAVETNGTIVAPKGIDWLCVSPKGTAPLKQKSGNELKLVYPQVESEAQPERFEHLAFDAFFLQPLDNSDQDKNTAESIAYCMRNPRWQLSLQTHKILGIP